MTHKRALLTTTALLVAIASSAMAQDTIGFVDDPFNDDPFADSNWNQPARGRSASDSSSGSERSLPSMDEDVSLDQFDNYYKGLITDVDKRLEQLSTTKPDVKKDALSGPDVAAKQNTLEQISDSQTEIKVLKMKLEQAQLAKQLWSEISGGSIDDLRGTISTLQAQVDEADQRYEQAISAKDAERDTLQQQLEEANRRLEESNQRLADAESEIQDLDGALRSAQQSQQTPSGPVRVVSDVPSTPGRTSTVASLVQPPQARVQKIQMVAGRAEAVLSYPGGAERSVTVDTVLPDGSRVTEIGRTGVQIIKDDNEFTLPRGTYSPSAPTQAPSPSPGVDTSVNTPSFEDNPFLEDAAYGANP